MLLPLSICGRKMSASRQNARKRHFYSKLMFPWKACSQIFHGSASALPVRKGRRVFTRRPKDSPKCDIQRFQIIWR